MRQANKRSVIGITATAAAPSYGGGMKYAWSIDDEVPTLAAAERPPWLMLLNSIMELMNTEIELGLTFIQVARTSNNPETKARNARNARKAYEVVARFLAAKDGRQTLIAGIVDRLTVLRNQLTDLEGRVGIENESGEASLH